MKPSVRYLMIAALALGIAGCKKEAPPPPPPAPPPPAAPAPAPKVEAPAPVPVTVGNITLGKAIGPDKKVTAAMDLFAKEDTIYASVESAGTGTATLKAKWTFHKGEQSAAVSEASETIVHAGPAVTAFNVSKPSGWPPGEYQVEIFLGDKSMGTKKFIVK